MYRSSRPPVYRQPAPAPRRKRKKHIAVTIICAVAAIMVIGAIVLLGQRKAEPVTDTAKQPTPRTATSTEQPANDNKQTEDEAAKKQQIAISDPASIWVVVNKKRPLNPKAYTPDNLVVPNVPLRANITSNEKYLRADAAKALERMVSDAKTAGVSFNLQSGYRAYSMQVSLYNGYVKSQGQAVADRQSARPGHSEHQTGLAADLGGVTRPACDVEQCYADTPEGKWLAANGYAYGFIIRYPADKEPVTGYMYEPWHIRYVGTELATKMRNSNVATLEEFFTVAGGVSY